MSSLHIYKLWPKSSLSPQDGETSSKFILSWRTSWNNRQLKILVVKESIKGDPPPFLLICSASCAYVRVKPTDQLIPIYIHRHVDPNWLRLVNCQLVWKWPIWQLPRHFLSSVVLTAALVSGTMMTFRCIRADKRHVIYVKRSFVTGLSMIYTRRITTHHPLR